MQRNGKDQVYIILCDEPSQHLSQPEAKSDIALVLDGIYQIAIVPVIEEKAGDLLNPGSAPEGLVRRRFFRGPGIGSG